LAKVSEHTAAVCRLPVGVFTGLGLGSLDGLGRVVEQLLGLLAGKRG
jgi:hypothetical protein